jgi:glucokinase
MADILADVGATNARFGFVGDTGAVDKAHTFKCEDFPTFQDAYRAYLERLGAEADHVK